MKNLVILYYHWYEISAGGTTLVYLGCKKVLATDATGKFLQYFSIPLDIPPQ